jgi:hypothetical protein
VFCLDPLVILFKNIDIFDISLNCSLPQFPPSAKQELTQLLLYTQPNSEAKGYVVTQPEWDVC